MEGSGLLPWGWGKKGGGIIGEQGKAYRPEEISLG